MNITTHPKAVPFAVVDCYGDCGEVTLTRAEYDRQMADPWAVWRCPKCGEDAGYNDRRSEELQASAE